jgi:hypothetical protein
MQPSTKRTARSRSWAEAPWVLSLPFAPCLLALNLPPSPTLLNQCFALGLWGACLAGLGCRIPANSLLRDTRVIPAAASLLAMGALGAAIFGALPLSIGLPNVVFVLTAILILVLGHASAGQSDGERSMSTLLAGLCVVGTVSAVIACVQVFAPEWPDGDWIARSGLAGRGVGNLRQPNHLASLLLWAAIGIVALFEMRRLAAVSTASLLGLLLLGVVLSGSRTGLLGTLMLALWGLVDRRLSRLARAALVIAPLFALLAWAGLAAWAHGTGHAFAGEGRLSAGGGDISSSRFAIWRDTLTMLMREPWLGVGFGEFNLAWTLTELPQRPTAFFDHTHNLPLQLLVELGLPLGLTVCALLCWAAWLAVWRAWRVDGDAGIARRAAAMMVLMVGLHSQLEYPLWYAYLLLPTAFFWGFALASAKAPAETAQSTAKPSWAMRGMGLALTLSAAAAVLDYRQVVVIYEPPEDAAPLEERIARGQRSLLFGHHADYAAATAFGEPKAPLSPSQKLAFQRAPHHLLDVRLMIAWAQALAAEGKVDQARWLAARIREFRNPGSGEFFALCADAAHAASAFQCQKPERAWHWREFVTR